MQAKYKQVRNEKTLQVKAMHTIVAEKALGKPLPFGAEVHHVNENRYDNRPENLVICPSRAYHMLLHRRMEAVAAGYPAHYRKCRYCGKYEDPEKLKLYSKMSNGYRISVAEHSICQSLNNMKSCARRKAHKIAAQ